MNKSTNLRAQKNKNGDVGILVSQQSTDSPIIPIEFIERLHAIRPEKVDWIFEQTQNEAEFRRKNDRLINNYIFIERLIGQIFGLLMGLTGIGASGYLGINNHEVLAGTIATATIATLSVSFIKSKNTKK